MCERGGETDREENQSHLDAAEVLACSPFFLTDQQARRERELNNRLLQDNVQQTLTYRIHGKNVCM